MTEIPGHTCFASAHVLATHLDEDDEGLLEWELEQCPACRRLVEELRRWGEEVENPDWLVAVEYPTAPDLAAELLPLPHPQQLRAVDSDEIYHQWGLAQYYLKESERYRFIDSQTSFERAEVAVRIVEGIAHGGDPLHYDPHWLADLRAKAWAYLANGWRLRREFSRAEEAFLEADAQTARGTGGRRARATVLTLRASLLTDQYREAEASILLERVVAVHRDAEDRPALGKALLQLSFVKWHLEDIPEAIRLAHEALPMLASESLRLNTRLNLAAYLLEVGDLEHAATQLAKIPAEAEAAVAVRRDWVAARLAHLRDEPDRARELFAAARASLAEETMRYEFALASLDLAILEHATGHTGRVREILDEALPLLMLEGVPHEVFAALQLVYDAINKDTLSLELLREVVRKLERLHPR